MPGELLVLPAADNDIALVGSEAVYLTEAVESATGYFQRGGAGRLSPIPYRLVDGRLEPWQPQAGARETAAIREAEVTQRVIGYGDFAQYLREHLGDAKDVSAVERGVAESTGLRFSYCTASLAGSTQLLPFVDYVGFENLEPQQEGWSWLRFDQLRELPGVPASPVWQYGLPMIAFDPAPAADQRREVSTALRDRAEDPWA
ncbi:hypothetical protein ACOBQX_02390 [Actinokineospora sp. G85]|uniref:hypothetical protein n=1 Tax=Actinokineospora sp. G85 TaxID=3406626 RepID=UPI003C75A4FE